jgi:hypothetical protein
LMEIQKSILDLNMLLAEGKKKEEDEKWDLNQEQAPNIGLGLAFYYKKVKGVNQL